MSAAALLLLACAGPQVTGTDGPEAEDERGVLRMADEIEKEFAASGRLVDAPPLDAYLRSVVERLRALEMPATSFRVRVIRDRHPNAMSVHNGALYVTTGFLARLDGEAQLAAILGHEMAHVYRRHSLLKQRRRSEVLKFFAHSALSAYSQSNEREADADGMAALARAGYDPADGYAHLVKGEAWAAAERLEDPRYPSHPPTEERVAALKAQVATLPAGGDRGVERYDAHLPEVLLVNARLELAAGRYDWARQQAERLVRLRPGSAAGHSLLGEIARRGAAGGWEPKAAAAFRKALELDPRLAEAWRGLGLTLQKTGDHAGARRALAAYLEAAPDAPDRGHFRAYLDGQEGKGSP